MDKLTIELDVADLDGDDLRGLIARSEAGGVKLTVLDPHGPGGGNPVVQVDGSHYALLGWLVDEYTAGDLGQAQVYLAGDYMTD